MASTREELKEYALRALGDPVVEINVADEQLEDRIDEALEYWRLYHHEGVEKMYLKHRLMPSKMFITSNNGLLFQQGSTLTGQTSGATAKVSIRFPGETPDLMTDATVIPIRDIQGTFLPGETVSDGINSAILAAADPITLGEFDLKYIQLPDSVYGVSRLIPFAATSVGSSMFDIQYQLRLHDLYDLTSTSIIYYKMTMNHLSMLDMELNAKPSIQFNRLQGRVYPNINWTTATKPGDYVIIDGYRALDPASFSRVWNEPWLKEYVIALFKRQWGWNLYKYSGIQLPGGVTIDGKSIYDMAINEIARLEDELMNKQAPLSFFLG